MTDASNASPSEDRTATSPSEGGTATFALQSLELRTWPLGARIFGVVGAGLGLAGALLTLYGSPPSVLFGGAAFAAVAGLWSGMATRPSTGGNVSVDATSLSIGTPSDSLVLEKPEIASAWDEGPVVYVETHGGPKYQLRFGTEESARACVRALDLGLGKRRLSWPLRGKVGAGTAAVAGSAFALVASIMLTHEALVAPSLYGFLAIILATLALAATGTRLARGRVTVGADGIVIERLWRRFIRFDRIANAKLAGDKLCLDLDDGSLVLLPLVGQSDVEAGVLLRRLHEGMHATSGAAPDIPELEPSGRSLSDWRREVVRLGSPVGGFRTQALEEADLDAILDDANAPLGRRAGAALALGAIDQDKVRVRLRDLSEASADARTRIVLGALADESLDDEHLSMLEAEAEERRTEVRPAHH